MKPKKLLTTLILIMTFGFLSSSLLAQNKVRRKDIEGTKWQLKIEVRDEIEEELDDADDAFERIIIKSVAGLVDGILDGIEIYFEFEPDNELRLTVEVFGETEVEYANWYINEDGALIIDDSDHFDTDDDDIWLFVDDVLVAFDQNRHGDLDDQPIYLVQID